MGGLRLSQEALHVIASAKGAKPFLTKGSGGAFIWFGLNQKIEGSNPSEGTFGSRFLLHPHPLANTAKTSTLLPPQRGSEVVARLHMPRIRKKVANTLNLGQSISECINFFVLFYIALTIEHLASYWCHLQYDRATTEVLTSDCKHFNH